MPAVEVIVLIAQEKLGRTVLQRPNEETLSINIGYATLANWLQHPKIKQYEPLELIKDNDVGGLDISVREVKRFQELAR